MKPACPRTCGPRQEKPPQWEVRAPKRESSLHSPQQKKSLHSNKDPAKPKININKKRRKSTVSSLPSVNSWVVSSLRLRSFNCFQAGTTYTSHRTWLRVRSPIFLSLIIFIGVQLLYNIVLVSTVQQSESATYIRICPLFWISFPSRSPENTRVEFPVLYGRFSLVIHFIHGISSVYIVYLKHRVTQGLIKFSPFHQYQLLLTKLGREKEGSFSLIWSESLQGRKTTLSKGQRITFWDASVHPSEASLHIHTCTTLTRAHKPQQAACGLSCFFFYLLTVSCRYCKRVCVNTLFNTF